MTVLAEGNSLKDGSNVLAKIAPAQSNGSMCLEREAHMYDHCSTTTLEIDLHSGIVWDKWQACMMEIARHCE